MATNVALDDRVLDEAHELGGHQTKQQTVTEALLEYIARRKQCRIVELFGTIDYDADYDHKAERTRLEHHHPG